MVRRSIVWGAVSRSSHNFQTLQTKTQKKVLNIIVFGFENMINYQQYRFGIKSFQFFIWPPSTTIQYHRTTSNQQMKKLVGGFNPFETYYIVKMEIFPKDRGENSKNIWNHQLDKPLNIIASTKQIHPALLCNFRSRAGSIGLWRHSCLGVCQGINVHPGNQCTTWKINIEPTNHPFRKENDLPNLHDYVPCYSSGV